MSIFRRKNLLIFYFSLSSAGIGKIHAKTGRLLFGLHMLQPQGKMAGVIYIKADMLPVSPGLLFLGKGKNHLHSSFKAYRAAVDAQIVAFCLAPFLAGVIIIVTGTFLVRLYHHILSLGSIYLVRFLQSCDLILIITADEHAYHVREVSQSVISATSNDNTGFLRGKLLNGIKLSQEYLVIQRAGS